MSTHKYIDRICIIITILALVITVLFINGKDLGLTAVVDQDAESYQGTEYFTANDLKYSPDSSNLTSIKLDGDDIEIDGTGAYIYENSVVISNGGYYEITGTLDNGSVIVNAYNSSKIWVILNNAEINCDDGACFQVEQADKVFLNLKEDTTNIMTCGSEFSSTAIADGISAACFARDDLTINGTGKLSINGAYKHGIEANDDMVIAGCDLTIEAAADAINANDSLRITEATVSATAGDDGFKIKKTDGYFYMLSGTVDINSSDDAINATSDVTIDGGELVITAADDGIHSDTLFTMNDGKITMNSCYEGIEAVNIVVNDGEITLYPTDDGFNANGETSGSTMFGGFGNSGGPMGNFGDATSGTAVTGDAKTDDSSDAKTDDLSDAKTDTENQGEPPSMDGAPGESSEADASSEDSSSSDTSSDENMPSDDKMNSDSSSSENADSTSSETSSEDSDTVDSSIKINGGTITIINENGNDADGLDSNGDIIITGGDIRISLNGTGGSNSALDYSSETGGTCEISGGTIIACGGSAMAEKFSETSEQCSFLYGTSETITGGKKLKLKNSDGDELLSWEVPLSYTAACVSCPEMELNETYTLKMGDEKAKITLESVSTEAGETSGGMGGGGFGGFGGMGQKPNFGNNGSTDESSMKKEDFANVANTSENTSSDDSKDSTENTSTDKTDNSKTTDDASNSGSTSTDTSDDSQTDSQQDNMGAPNGQMPAGSFSPDGSAMPEGQAPDGSFSPDAQMGGPGGAMNAASGDSVSNDSSEITSDTTTSTLTSLSDVDSQVWIWLIASVITLLLGLIAVILFRRH
ncbi:MAG: carbohydrate-binding domain-containing protein [Lachnospiraceae bacterium]|nr:carbohydrate-binding domain-containing protein [Lachnospiraceae bacterium]